VARSTARRLRLDAELVRRGLARSREHAAGLIADRRVTVAGTVATKPATAVETAAALVVRDDVDDLEPTRVVDGEPAGWRAHRDGRTLVLRSEDGAGDDGAGAGDDEVAALRALCRAAWDGAGDPDGHDDVRGDDDRAGKVISALGLGEG